MADGAVLLGVIGAGAGKDIQLVLHNGALALRSPHSGNKKVPPKTIIMLCKKGAVNKGGKGLEWKFQGPLKKCSVVHGKDIANLHDIIVKNKVKGVAKHTPETFPEGVPPSSLSPSAGSLRFMAEQADFQAALELAEKLGTATLVWIVSAREGKAQLDDNDMGYVYLL